MIQIWITGLLLLAQPSGPPDSLTVTQQGRTIATVNREKLYNASSRYPDD